MSAWQILGGLMLAAIIGGMAVLMVRLMGWWETAIIWGGSALLTALVVVGVGLLVGVLP